jgi:hypothetical protein
MVQGIATRPHVAGSWQPADRISPTSRPAAFRHAGHTDKIPGGYVAAMQHLFSPGVRSGSRLCENEIRFGRNAEPRMNFCVFFAVSMTTSLKIPGAVIPRFSHSLGQKREC